MMDSLRAEALVEAGDLIQGDRELDYGPPEVNFKRIADIWNVIFPFHEWSPREISLAMIALKLARTPEGYKRDTYIDIIGYAALSVELNESGDTGTME